MPNLVSTNERARITVTQDLRKCKYVDRVLQMRDRKFVQVIEDKYEIESLASGELPAVAINQ